MMNSQKLVLFMACLMLPVVASAGAGSNVEACVFFAHSPTQPFVVDFTAGGSNDHCMNATGENARLLITQAGVSCTPVGYVEGKSSSTGGDLCATDTSTWLLSYAVPDSAMSGSTESEWRHPMWGDNYVKLKAATQDTVICGTHELCQSDVLRWRGGTADTAYVIFSPETATYCCPDAGVVPR